MSLISQRVPYTSTNFYGFDAHGSVRFLTDVTGSVSDTYVYDAYGTIIASSGSTANNYLYSGEQNDPDLGLYYLRARYYAPGTGRFWTMDTFEGSSENPLSLHKYLYCQGSPLIGTDPSGHDDDMPSLMATFQTIGYMAANVWLRAAPALTRVTIILYESATGTTVAVGGGAAITGYAAMSRVEGGIGSWVKAESSLTGVGFGPAGYVKTIIRNAFGQVNHLNQSAAYRQIIKKAGAAIELDGNAFVAGTEHNQFHVVLERFWSQYRREEGGASAGEVVSNQGYLQAVREGLANVKDAFSGIQKFSQKQIDALMGITEQEQRGNGYFDGPGGLHPEVPSSMHLNTE